MSYPETGDTIRFTRNTGATPKADTPIECRNGSWGQGPTGQYTIGCKCGECNVYGTPTEFVGIVKDIAIYSDAVEASVLTEDGERHNLRLAHISEGFNYGHATKTN